MDKKQMRYQDNLLGSEQATGNGIFANFPAEVNA
jgi:hypothetical protein